METVSGLHGLRLPVHTNCADSLECWQVMHARRSDASHRHNLQQETI